MVWGDETTRGENGWGGGWAKRLGVEMFGGGAKRLGVEMFCGAKQLGVEMFCGAKQLGVEMLCGAKQLGVKNRRETTRGETSWGLNVLFPKMIMAVIKS